MNIQTQTIAELASSPALAPIRTSFDRQRLLQAAVAVQQIPAPTFAEGQRAAYVKTQFEQYGLCDVVIDDLFNVYGRLPGHHPERPAVLVSAHLDTVFPADTDLSIHYEHDLVYGPGLGDNSLGVASLLTLVDVFQRHKLRPAADIWFVANSCEEGLGDLGGIRAVWQRLGPRLGAGVVIEGLGLGRIYHAGIAVRRLHITCRAEGGHSWQHFGRPTAVHGLIDLGARIIALKPPASPRTTFNIGLISGGHSVNSIASHAELYLDLRSESPDTLVALEAEVRAALQAAQAPGLEFSTEIVGDRPAGSVPVDHPLVQLATAALQVIGHQAAYDTGSTDANMLLANHLPAITIGIAYGGNSHRLDEFIDLEPALDGLWHLLLIVLAAAKTSVTWSRST